MAHCAYTKFLRLQATFRSERRLPSIVHSRDVFSTVPRLAEPSSAFYQGQNCGRGHVDGLSGRGRRHCSSRAKVGSIEIEGLEEAPNASDSRLTGLLHVIMGPMFAGKTSELLRRAKAEEAAGLRVAMVKSNKDVRYAVDSVVAHDGQARACFAVPTLAHLREDLGDRFHDYHVFAIDEAQFFPDLLDFCQTVADHEQKKVIVAGLDGDFRRQRFGQILDLVPMADSVERLVARCAYCPKPALFTLRIAADDRQELVGGADKYAPVCRHHYVSLDNVRGHLPDAAAQ